MALGRSLDLDVSGKKAPEPPLYEFHNPLDSFGAPTSTESLAPRPKPQTFNPKP